MRGKVNAQPQMLFALDLEQMVPADHPLREIRRRADDELKRLRSAFKAAYSDTGRPSIPPEQLIKALLLQSLYSIRSERQLVEQVGYNMLFRWFLGMSPEDPVFSHTVFTKNRERFEEHGLLRRFFEGSVAQALAEEAAATDQFSVDGTLIQSWASMKSVRPKDDDEPHDGNGWSKFKGEKRSNKTHESATDPEARLAKRSSGGAAILAHSMHAISDNENGLILSIAVDEANGRAERTNAEKMLKSFRRRHHFLPVTLAQDAGYDDGAHLRRLEEDFDIIPMTAIRSGKICDSGPNGQAREKARRRAQTKRYRKAQRHRRKIEGIFGWLKQVAGLKRARHVDRWKLQQEAFIAGAAYNFLRMGKLRPA